MIVSFSGIDSSGKSTQIKLLEKYLKENKIRYIKKWGKIRGTPGILFLKSIFRKDKNMSKDDINNYREQIYSSRFKSWLLLNLSLIDFILYFGIYYRLLNVIYKYVICDRYLWDSYVEIKTEFKSINIDKNLLWIIAKIVVPKPKYSIIFTIPSCVSYERDIKKHDPSIENEVVKEEKIKLYKHLIDKGKWKTEISGLLPIEVIHNKVKEVVVFDNKIND